MEAKLLKFTPNSNKKSLTRSKDLSQNITLKLLDGVIFPSLPSQFGIPFFTMSNFNQRSTHGNQTSQNKTKLKEKTSD